MKVIALLFALRPTSYSSPVILLVENHNFWSYTEHVLVFDTRTALRERIRSGHD
jgi:hypothetical protein